MSKEPNALRRVLGQAPPPADVEQRIVQGALSRMHDRASVSTRRRRLVWGLALAAATATVLFLYWARGKWASTPGHNAPEMTHKEDKQPDTIAIGTEWTAPKTTRRVTIGHHHADLAPRSSMQLTDGTAQAPQLRLEQGRAAFSVQPLSPGRTFTVQTPHARVVVLGTRFTVALEPRCTQVEVFTGRVRVSSKDGQTQTLEPGGKGAYCEPQASALDQAGREVRRAISLLRKGDKLAEAETILARHLEGTYAEEAHYFLVLVKRRLGKHKEAVTQAVTFLKRFPGTTRAATLRRWLEKNPP